MWWPVTYKLYCKLGSAGCCFSHSTETLQLCEDNPLSLSVSRSQFTLLLSVLCARPCVTDREKHIDQLHLHLENQPPHEQEVYKLRQNMSTWHSRTLKGFILSALLSSIIKFPCDALSKCAKFITNPGLAASKWLLAELVRHCQI